MWFSYFQKYEQNSRYRESSCARRRGRPYPQNEIVFVPRDGVVNVYEKRKR